MPQRKPLSGDELQRARGLRRNSTFPERILWSRLRGGRLAGVKFRRQHTLGPYVLDFYCHEQRLAIELDGESHIGRAVYDANRTALIEQSGIRVLRITNDDVLRDLDAVLDQIALACRLQP